MDDAKDDHITVNDAVVDDVRVAYEGNTPDAGPVLDLLSAFGKLGNPFEYASDPPFEARRRKWIF
jgi:hypothetical protein